ncbi:hypothetical protein D046_2329A, partial [Vibrio parahaemolyticus V-223/04]
MKSWGDNYSNEYDCILRQMSMN